MPKQESVKKTESLKAWLDKKDYWERFLWNLHLSKGAPNNEDLQKCYQLALEDAGVVGKSLDRPTITFPDIDLNDTEAISSKITLDKIENLRNINALDNTSVIEFGKNLTIIYGDNGSGKSGIGRLLSNACLSRKPRELLPNAKADSSSRGGNAKADLYISESSGSRIINYTIGDHHDALKRFSVFDHECAPVHLNDQNKIEFVPAKIQIFDQVFKSVGAIEELFENDVRSKTKEDPVENLFSDTSKVSVFLKSLSYATTDQQITDSIEFTDADKKLLETGRANLATKQKQDISKQKKELLEECKDLEVFKRTLSEKGGFISAAKAEEVNGIIKDIKEKKEIAEKLSAKNFEFVAFKTIGSPEWKAFITAAQKLHEKETASNKSEPEYCLLCHQALRESEKLLFTNYWAFLKSTAEKELEIARRSLKNILDECNSVANNWPHFLETESAVKILKREAPADLTKLENAFTALTSQLLGWIQNIEKEQPISFTEPQLDLNPITALVASKKDAESKLVDPTPEIKALNVEILSLEHKQQAFGMIQRIKGYISWLRWQKATGSLGFSQSKTSITKKKTELMNELVVSRYEDLFNEETKKLDCSFGLQVKSRGRSGETVKELKLNFADNYSPSEILSEGEQTISALADFLVEANLQSNNAGIIFDDPVNSLDHLRKPVIAERLVEESKKRQVVVLTHDIMFLTDLQFYANRDLVDCKVSSMRKIDNQPGVIKKELPWIAQNVKDRIGYLKNQLPALKKIENGDQDEYRIRVKGWYGMLYEGWERAIEERVFKKVIQRFSREVHPLRLSKVVVTDEIKKDIDVAMTEVARWRHDQPAGVSSSVPKSAKLEADLKSLEDFDAKCKAD